MNEKTIILDLDDTLCDLKNPMCNALNNYTNKDHHWKTWDSFIITEKYGISHNELFDVIINSNILPNLEPYPETLSFLTYMKENGISISIITSRAYHPNAAKLTEDWFNKYDLPYDEIHISGHGVPKTEYMKHNKNVIMAIDDRIENCLDFVKCGMVQHTLLYDMPWNQGIDLKRIKNLTESYNYV